jgi:hypothetical protein
VLLSEGRSGGPAAIFLVRHEYSATVGLIELAEGNLMKSKKTFDVTEKTAIAGGWEGSGLSQEEWAGRHGISSRTLRKYLRRYRPARHWDAELQVVASRAIESLNAIIRQMSGGTSTGPEPGGARPEPVQPGRKFNWDD